MRIAALLLVTTVGFGQVSPVTSLTLEFDTPGVLPSSTLLFAYQSWANTIPEPAAFSVQNGVLSQSCFASQYGAYYFAGSLGAYGTTTPWAFAFAGDIVVEARVRIVQSQGRSIQLFFMDGFFWYGLWLDTTAGNFEVQGTTPVQLPVPFAAAGPGFDPTQFHTYRLERDAGTSTYRVFVDDRQIHAGNGSAVGGNVITFGNDPLTGTADAEWDYVRIFNGPNLFANPLSMIGTPNIGNTVYLSVFSPQTPNAPFGVGFTLSPLPGIPLPDGRVVPLTPDPLFWAALMPGTGVFYDVTGVLGPTGFAAPATSVAIPNDPGLVGVTVYTAALTGDPNLVAGIGRIGAAVPITVLP